MKYFLFLPSVLIAFSSNPIFAQNGKVLAIKQELFEAKYDGENNIIAGSKLDDPDNNWTKKYDDRGTLIEKKGLNINGSLNYSLTLQYDKSGNPTEEKEVFANGSVRAKYRYKYSSKGELIEENVYDGNGVLSSRTVWERDSFGFAIGQKAYDGNGNPTGNHVLKNNLFGKLVEDNSYNGKGALELKFYFSYDIYGNRILQYAYFPDGKLKNIIHYSFVYDDFGNWIEKVKKVNGNLKTITKRQITYADNSTVFVAGHLPKKSDLEMEGLYGSIAKVKQEEYFAKYETGRASSPVIKTTLSDDRRHNYILSYNQKGNKQNVYQRAANGGSSSKLIFSYATNGNLVEMHEEDDITHKTSYRETYNYEGKNMTEKLITFYSDGDSSKFKYSYGYDESGNVILELCFTSGDSLLEGKAFKYDVKGYLIEEDYINGYGAVKSISNYKYDSSGLIVEAWSTDNEYRNITVYTYDALGNVTETLVTRVNNDGTETKIKSTKIDYEYDSKGNWTKKTIFENYSPTYIVLRSYTYN